MLSSNKLISDWLNKTFNVQHPLCLCAVQVLDDLFFGGKVLEDIVIFNVHHSNTDLCHLHLVMFSLTTLSKLNYMLRWDLSYYQCILDSTLSIYSLSVSILQHAVVPVSFMNASLPVASIY